MSSQKMETAETYEEWLEAATRLDELEGGSAWKRDPKSPHYDSERIQKRLNEMYKVRSLSSSLCLVLEGRGLVTEQKRKTHGLKEPDWHL